MGAEGFDDECWAMRGDVSVCVALESARSTSRPATAVGTRAGGVDTRSRGNELSARRDTGSVDERWIVGAIAANARERDGWADRLCAVGDDPVRRSAAADAARRCTTIRGAAIGGATGRSSPTHDVDGAERPVGPVAASAATRS